MRTGGGNDVVANSGMSIFSWRNGALAAVYETDYRNPTLGTIPGKGPVIFLHAWLWPDFAAHAEAREYLDDILAYRRGTFTSIRNEEARTFRALADSNLARYRELKPKFLHDTLVTVTDSLGTRDTLPGSGEYSGPHPLFSDAALAIILLGHADGRAPIRAFWAAEHEYLVRRMPAEQYNALDDLYRFWGGLEPRQ
jgi:hypothetical protein